MNVSTFSMCLPREKSETLRQIAVINSFVTGYGVSMWSQCLRYKITVNKFETLRQVWDNFEMGNLLCFIGMNQDVLKS